MEEKSKVINLLCPPQSLQSTSYNHFSAIYYLLLERVREHRAQQLSRQCGTWSQRPRSTSDSSSPEVSTTARTTFRLLRNSCLRSKMSSGFLLDCRRSWRPPTALGVQRFQ